MLRRLFAALLFASLVGTAAAQNLREEVPLQALTDVAQFDDWAIRFRQAFNLRMSQAQPGAITSVRIIKTEQRQGYTLYTISTTHAQGFNMGGQADGGILAVPTNPDPRKPIAVAIHGHEESPWATFPTFMFRPSGWGLSLVQAGYVVWAPVSMIHAPFSHVTYARGGIGNGKGDVYGYIPIWARMMSDNIDAMLSVAYNVPHSGLAVLGVSGGGHVAFTLMAYRQDIRAGVFAGAQQPLDFYRHEYAEMEHERCWNIPGMASFTQIKALIAPRPIQFQLGKADPWWPNGQKFAAQAGYYPGSSRDVLVDEVAGQFLILKQIWSLKGGVAEQHYHQGGHELDAPAAISFLNRN
jgi:dienelactone hydrolase